MKDKYITIFIIPHFRGRQRAISISRKSYKTLKIVLPLLGLLFAAFLVDYALMNGMRQKYKRLQQDYLSQTRTLRQYQESVGKLEAKIRTFDAYRRKLNIMAGLKSEEAIDGEPGIGGPSVEPQVLPPNPSQGLSKLQDINSRAKGIQDNLITLSNFFEDQLAVLAQTPSIMPTQGYMVSGFKWRNDPFTGKWTFHPGLDISTQYGNPVVATADGIVLQTKVDKVGGNTVKISHPKTGYITIIKKL